MTAPQRAPLPPRSRARTRSGLPSEPHRALQQQRAYRRRRPAPGLAFRAEEGKDTDQSGARGMTKAGAEPTPRLVRISEAGVATSLLDSAGLVGQLSRLEGYLTAVAVDGGALRGRRARDRCGGRSELH